MYIKKIIVFIFFLLSFLLSCRKDEYYQEGSELLYFLSLTADQDTLHFGETTLITAEVAGNNVSFKWYSQSGVILGSGYQIKFVATCTCKTNDIFCTAFAQNRSETKTVTITIY
jgi:hypothetical protein